MARLLRIQFQGAIYHAMARGIERRVIFRDEADCRRFVEELQEGVTSFAIRLYAFCLLGNHYHLLFETPHANLSVFMQALQSRYAIYFNRRHRRWGHLMQGRYKAKLVEGDQYLLRLSRYVHLNPVATRAKRPLSVAQKRRLLRGYRWSSYRAYIGAEKEPAWLSAGPLRNMVPGPARSPRRAYQQYVELGLAETDREWEEIMARSSLAVGSEEFLERVKGWYQAVAQEAEKPEDVAFRQIGWWLPGEEVREVVLGKLGIEEQALWQRRGGGLHRAILARMLIRYGGWTQRQVAERFGLGSGAAVSMALKKLREAVGKKRSWRSAVEEMGQDLSRRMRRRRP